MTTNETIEERFDILAQQVPDDKLYSMPRIKDFILSEISRAQSETVRDILKLATFKNNLIDIEAGKVETLYKWEVVLYAKEKGVDLSI